VLLWSKPERSGFTKRTFIRIPSVNIIVREVENRGSLELMDIRAVNQGHDHWREFHRMGIPLPNAVAHSLQCPGCSYQILHLKHRFLRLDDKALPDLLLIRTFLRKVVLSRQEFGNTVGEICGGMVRTTTQSIPPSYLSW